MHEFQRAVRGTPALLGVFVASMQGELKKAWPEEGSAAITQAVAQLATLCAAGEAGLSALGAAAPLDRLSLESEDRLLVLSRLDAEAVAGFLFDRTAPIGLARLQAKQLARQLQRERAA